jgi:bacterioferritin
MGTRGRAVVNMDIEELLLMLQKAYCDEWFAYYQYWLGAKVIKGPMSDAVAAELLQHATEELNHANLVADRLIQLGGTPTLEPKQWYDLSNCTYDPPADAHVKTLLEQNIRGEQCAIDVYSDMLRKTRDGDPVTYNIALTILGEEEEHEEDLQSLQEDLELLLARSS